MTNPIEAAQWHERQAIIREHTSIRDTLHALIDAQYAKGMQTYGIPLEKAQNVDMRLMALEEMQDLCAYLIAEIKERDREIARLREVVGDADTF